MNDPASLVSQIQSTIRDVHDFPKKGIVFKDITPVLADPALCRRISSEIVNYWKSNSIDAIVGIESRGFIFGMQLAQGLNVPFVPVRKVGKLPAETYKYAYDLEYGQAELEIHKDAFTGSQSVLIHDDLLATGGTAAAAAELVLRAGGKVGGYSFLIELDFLNGRNALGSFTDSFHSLIHY